VLPVLSVLVVLVVLAVAAVVPAPVASPVLLTPVSVFVVSSVIAGPLR
jgi:hypothetical protein